MIACSNQTQTEEPKKEQEVKVADTEEEKETESVKIPKAPTTVETMIKQSEGILVKEHLDKELEVGHGWNVGDYGKFYDSEFKAIIEKELLTYFEEHQELTKDEVYDYLVYLLSSGQYEDYYDKLVNYEHGFEMPELPTGEDTVETKERKRNVVVLIDGSGSMKAEVTGGNKMALAKETIGKFVEEIDEDVDVSLIVYGHIGTGNDADKQLSCSSIESVYPLQSYDTAAFEKALNSFQASGWTPLAGAIDKAGEILQGYNSNDYENIVYIVSDGIETCDGDPIAAAKKLQENNIKAKVNIIGFDVDDDGQKQLQEVADAGDGIYATVRDKSELETEVLKKWRPTLGQIVWTQGVTLNDTVDAMQRMNNIYNPLYYASDREKGRIKNAIYFLSDKELISHEAKSYVLDMADQMSAIRESHFKEIKEKKDEETWAASEEINAKVEEWKKSWQE